MGDDTVGESGVRVGIGVSAGPKFGEGENVATAVVQRISFTFVAGRYETGQAG